jgi:hypothetical protein
MSHEHETWSNKPETPLSAYCRACGKQIDPRAVICPQCGVPQTIGSGEFVPDRPSAKSVGLAIFLSFIWPGAGHLYVGIETDKGIAFTCVSGLCFLISWTIIGLLVTVPVWFGTALYTMLDSSKAARRRNAALPALHAG